VRELATTFMNYSFKFGGPSAAGQKPFSLPWLPRPAIHRKEKARKLFNK
jgi:hypothetical protein